MRKSKLVALAFLGFLWWLVNEVIDEVRADLLVNSGFIYRYYGPYLSTTTTSFILIIINSVVRSSSLPEATREDRRYKIDGFPSLDSSSEESLSGVKTFVRNRAKTLLATLDRRNCLAKVLCGLGVTSSRPSQKTDLLNDYTYILNELMGDGEGSDEDENTKGKDDLALYKYVSQMKPKDKFEHMYYDDDNVSELTSIERDPEIAFLAEQELAEEDPGILRFIEMERRKRLKLKAKDGMRNNFKNARWNSLKRSLDFGLKFNFTRQPTTTIMPVQTLINRTDEIIQEIKSSMMPPTSNKSRTNVDFFENEYPQEESSTPKIYKLSFPVSPESGEYEIASGVNKLKSTHRYSNPKKQIASMSKKVHDMANSIDPEVYGILKKWIKMGKLNKQDHKGLMSAVSYINAEKYLKKKIHRQISSSGLVKRMANGGKKPERTFVNRRQCRLLFNACPLNDDQIQGVVSTVKNVMQGQQAVMIDDVKKAPGDSGGSKVNIVLNINSGGTSGQPYLTTPVKEIQGGKVVTKSKKKKKHGSSTFGVKNKGNTGVTEQQVLDFLYGAVEFDEATFTSTVNKKKKTNKGEKESQLSDLSEPDPSLLDKIIGNKNNKIQGLPLPSGSNSNESGFSSDLQYNYGNGAYTRKNKTEDQAMAEYINTLKDTIQGLSQMNKISEELRKQNNPPKPSYSKKKTKEEYESSEESRSSESNEFAFSDFLPYIFGADTREESSSEERDGWGLNNAYKEKQKTSSRERGKAKYGKAKKGKKGKKGKNKGKVPYIRSRPRPIPSHQSKYYNHDFYAQAGMFPPSHLPWFEAQFAEALPISKNHNSGYSSSYGHKKPQYGLHDDIQYLDLVPYNSDEQSDSYSSSSSEEFADDVSLPSKKTKYKVVKNKAGPKKNKESDQENKSKSETNEKSMLDGENLSSVVKNHEKEVTYLSGILVKEPQINKPIEDDEVELEAYDDSDSTSAEDDFIHKTKKKKPTKITLSFKAKPVTSLNASQIELQEKKKLEILTQLLLPSAPALTIKKEPEPILTPSTPRPTIDYLFYTLTKPLNHTKVINDHHHISSAETKSKAPQQKSPTKKSSKKSQSNRHKEDDSSQEFAADYVYDDSAGVSDESEEPFPPVMLTHMIPYPSPQSYEPATEAPSNSWGLNFFKGIMNLVSGGNDADPQIPANNAAFQPTYPPYYRRGRFSGESFETGYPGPMKHPTTEQSLVSQFKSYVSDFMTPDGKPNKNADAIEAAPPGYYLNDPLPQRLYHQNLEHSSFQSHKRRGTTKSSRTYQSSAKKRITSSKPKTFSDAISPPTNLATDPSITIGELVQNLKKPSRKFPRRKLSYKNPTSTFHRMSKLLRNYAKIANN